MGRNYPRDSLRSDPATPLPPKAMVEDGFTQVKNIRHGKGGGKTSTRMELMPKENRQGKSFKALGSLNEGEEVPAMPMVEDQQEGPIKAPVEEEVR